MHLIKYSTRGSCKTKNSGKLFDIKTDFLNFTKQKAVLNEKYSSWTSIEAGTPQRLTLGLLLFFIYIKDLCYDLTTNVKLSLW